MRYAIILAGGIGSRFWPLSREKQPKQFLNIYSNKSMIEGTIARLKDFINRKNIYIAINKVHFKDIKKYMRAKGIPEENLFLEPEGKNTLAPIGLLSERIYEFDSDAIIAVLPCDHFIKEESKIIRLFKAASDVAEKGYILTFGIVPDRAETGYGYIKSGRIISKGIYKVSRFIEKPSLSKAKKLIKQKGYFWNSGVFIFKANTILNEIRVLTPKINRILFKIKSRRDLNRLWHKLPSVSIDYGIMEKTTKAAVLPVECTWLDLGSWQSVGEMFRKDKNGNIFRGNYLDLDSKNSIVWSQKRLVATLGLDNIIIVDTKDALLVCKKERAQDIKQLVRLLKKKRKACV